MAWGAAFVLRTRHGWARTSSPAGRAAGRGSPGRGPRRPARAPRAQVARVGGRQRRCARRHCAVPHHAFKSRRRAEHKYRRHLAVHPEGVGHPHRDRGCAACLKLEPMLASLNREPSLQHDVALVLRMGVKWRRRVVRKQELDQGEASVGCLTRQLDGGQSSKEPEPLPVAGGRPSRRWDSLTRHLRSVAEAIARNG